MITYWLLVACLTLVLGSFLYFASKPLKEDTEYWWVIPRRLDVKAARRYMQWLFDVDVPYTQLVSGFTWCGPLSWREAAKLPKGALWLVSIHK